MPRCGICSNYIKRNDDKTYCTNCDAVICEECEMDEKNMINGNQYCNDCYEELADELNNPDLGDDGYYNLYG